MCCLLYVGPDGARLTDEGRVYNALYRRLRPETLAAKLELSAFALGLCLGRLEAAGLVTEAGDYWKRAETVPEVA